MIFRIASITTQLVMSQTETVTIVKNVYDRTSYIKLPSDFYHNIFSTYIRLYKYKIKFWKLIWRKVSYNRNKSNWKSHKTSERVLFKTNLQTNQILNCLLYTNITGNKH